MLYYNFKDYEEFKTCLAWSSMGTTTRAEGTKSCWLI